MGEMLDASSYTNNRIAVLAICICMRVTAGKNSVKTHN